MPCVWKWSHHPRRLNLTNSHQLRERLFHSLHVHLQVSNIEEHFSTLTPNLGGGKFTEVGLEKRKHLAADNNDEL